MTDTVVGPQIVNTENNYKDLEFFDVKAMYERLGMVVYLQDHHYNWKLGKFQRGRVEHGYKVFEAACALLLEVLPYMQECADKDTDLPLLYSRAVEMYWVRETNEGDDDEDVLARYINATKDFVMTPENTCKLINADKQSLEKCIEILLSMSVPYRQRMSLHLGSHHIPLVTPVLLGKSSPAWFSTFLTRAWKLASAEPVDNMMKDPLEIAQHYKDLLPGSLLLTYLARAAKSPSYIHDDNARVFIDDLRVLTYHLSSTMSHEKPSFLNVSRYTPVYRPEENDSHQHLVQFYLEYCQVRPITDQSCVRMMLLYLYRSLSIYKRHKNALQDDSSDTASSDSIASRKRFRDCENDDTIEDAPAFKTSAPVAFISASDPGASSPCAADTGTLLESAETSGEASFMASVRSECVEVPVVSASNEPSSPGASPPASD